MAIWREFGKGMERNELILCCVTGLLGLISAATGFAAEATRIKGSEIQFVSENHCSYPQSPALGLGLTAAFSLLLAQIIVNAATGCICCKRNRYPSSSGSMLSLVSFIISWFTFLIAFVLLLTGAALNDRHGEDSVYFGNYFCYVVKPGVFASGAVFAFASVCFSLLCYQTLNLAKRSADANGIALGRPQAAAHINQTPVFVPQGTQMRQQFT